MSSASWTPATSGSSATWDSNKTRADLGRAATTYDDSSVTYDSATTYYDGFDPTTTTPEGENPATWANATNGSGASWAAVSE